MQTNISLRLEKSDATVKLPGVENASADAALFRAAVGKVNVLPEHNRVKPEKRPRVYRQAEPPPALPDILSDSNPGDTPNDFLRNGLSRLSLRKLRRAAIEDRLDLHGSHIDAARQLLQQFLQQCVQRELRCVLVIHGKNGGVGVLRKLSRHWLMQLPVVLAWCEAPPREGGSGAVLVLLKHVVCA